MRRSAVVLTLLIALALPCVIHGSTVYKTRRFGEARAGKALVYVIREKAFVGGGVGMFVFADEQLLAFVRNSSYSFAYVDPGRRLVWGDTPSGLDVELIAGETYYVAVKPVNPIVLMTEAEGKKAIETVAAYIESDQGDVENAAKKVAKKYEKVQKREAKKEKADVEEVAVDASAPAAGTLRLAANTRIAIELMEHLSSSLNRMGETVWFRVAGEVAVDGGVVVPKGSRVKATVRQAKAGTSFGEQGMIDIALVSIDLDGGSRIPLIGQLAAAGDDRAAGVMTGLVVGAFIKGTEAFYPAGTGFSAWTREDVWLPPLAAGTAVRTAHGGLSAPARELVFGQNTRRDPPPVELTFPCAGDSSDVQLVSAGDWELPEPLKASSVARDGGVCTARFGGWPMLRLVRVSDSPQPLHLHARSGGADIHVDVPVRMRLE